MRTVILALLPLFVWGGHALAWTHAADKNLDDPGHQHPAPGASIVRFGQVDDGVYKGSRPKNDADFKFLQSKHIKTILELKFLPFLDRSERRKANSYGITFKTALMNASPFAPSEKHVVPILRILRDKRYQPIYFHCDIGRDRTSLIAGLYEVYFRGMSPQEAWQDMTRFGFKDSWTLGGLKKYFQKHPRRPLSLDTEPLNHDAPAPRGSSAMQNGRSPAQLYAESP